MLQLTIDPNMQPTARDMTVFTNWLRLKSVDFFISLNPPLDV